MAYTMDKIRNVALLGHGGDGKTSLAESLLFLTGGTDRLGKPADGNTICDYDAEEIKRQISIQLSLAPVETSGYKYNFIDTPGYFDFCGEIAQALKVADCGVICLSAKGGVAVGTEKAWKYLSEAGLPKIFYVSKLDEEHANFDTAYEALRDTFGVGVTPLVIPVMDGNKPVGVVDIAAQKAYMTNGNKTTEGPVPAGLADRVAELRDTLLENVAENDEELMEKYFEGEEFTAEELARGLRTGVVNGSIAPVVCGSANLGVGTMALLNILADYAPSPADAAAVKAHNAAGEATEIAYDPNGKPIAVVFKTIADQFGRFSYFKVLSGTVQTDVVLNNPTADNTEKLGHIYVVKGKKNTEVKEIVCGDIGAVSKLTFTKTGDTLCDPSVDVIVDPIVFDEPCYSQAIAPKVRGGEEKIATGLNKLKDEDPTFAFNTNPETKQMVVSGAGDIHLDVLCSKLKSKFGVEVELSAPIIPYREKIRRKVEYVEGNHKKQSGGHGQYGNVKMDFEPIEGDDFIFEEKVFGGAVPKNFYPAVEKGIREAMVHGVIAGFPLVGLKATLVDGKYHDVDSNEMSFKMAARLAYKAGIPQASPVVLEPVYSLKVFAPDTYTGAIIGDLNKRRGRPMGMTPIDGGMQVIEAEIPLAEISDYAIALRSMTQGRGSFTTKFERYEETPLNVQEKIVAEYKDQLEEDN